ncbi:TetR/AcrR family transcriptional regulator [Larkinella terrae]|uniref:TetR family transcriptional regulator n=1 Tax=Larkinella terrae TaxID=2025311 RepID=A0A7K0ER07_9BACT|nr:TetR/AcrR family transcriptional regulator [Larkinella terrae]MRS63981.1 TetR family transcriptional regulator [Larkinella terrae]
MIEVRKRSRTQTKARILQAVGDVISERGVNRVGINAVAEKAGVNKVLIYRYFGGWEGLLEQFLKEGHFLSEYNQEFLKNNSEPDQISKSQTRVNYLIGLLRELKVRTSAQEMLKWEISNPGSYLSQQLVGKRNESFRKILETFFSDEKEDQHALTAILVSGISMLLLMAPGQQKFMDIDLQSDEGWQRIEHAIHRFYNP